MIRAMCFFTIVLSTSAFAYIEPGTGGLIISSLSSFFWSVLAVILAFFVKYFWKPIKRLFKKDGK